MTEDLEELQEVCERLLAKIGTLREELDWALGKLDALRALLREALPWVTHFPDSPDEGLRARIAKELGDEP
jgi:hypothetical protein